MNAWISGISERVERSDNHTELVAGLAAPIAVRVLGLDGEMIRPPRDAIIQPGPKDLRRARLRGKLYTTGGVQL